MGAAQHVTGIHQGEKYAGKELMGAIVAEPDELIHGLGNIGLGVEGLEEVFTLLLATTIDKFHVLFLDKSAVHKHHRRQIAGCRRAKDIAFKTVPDEAGDAARVIDVRVGKNQTIDALAPAKPATVFFYFFLALALKQAAIEHDGFAVNFEQMLRAGHGMNGAIEGDFHAALLLGDHIYSPPALHYRAVGVHLPCVRPFIVILCSGSTGCGVTCAALFAASESSPLLDALYFRLCQYIPANVGSEGASRKELSQPT